MEVYIEGVKRPVIFIEGHGLVSYTATLVPNVGVACLQPPGP